MSQTIKIEFPKEAMNLLIELNRKFDMLMESQGTPPRPPKWLSVVQAATVLGKTPNTIRRHLSLPDYDSIDSEWFTGDFIDGARHVDYESFCDYLMRTGTSYPERFIHDKLNN